MSPPKPKSATSAADLHFERKNQDMVKLPQYARVHKRPIPHAPISSPYAGPSVPKTIYVSTSTPYMSAVKRVQKLLRHAEKRAVASLSNLSKTNSKKANPPNQKGSQGQQEKLLAALARGEEREQLSSEEVLVKATGRAMGTALKVGKWFEGHGREAEYKVRLKTGSVLVVDDIEEDEGRKEGYIRELEGRGRDGAEDSSTSENEAGTGTGNETTLMTTADQGDPTILSETYGEATAVTAYTSSASKAISKSALKKRKRAAGLAASLADTELPETRTRWVNSVEVAISLK
ncbi:ribonuclease P subunit p20 family protein [Aspergillus stella-maris]|uniref:ribonuclease P subunit p20 family protein n=1 Tax=Aspergillus stella-maris TaxID=1810926 RepID=UPI003CCCB88F